MDRPHVSRNLITTEDDFKVQDDQSFWMHECQQLLGAVGGR